MNVREKYNSSEILKIIIIESAMSKMIMKKMKNTS